eukprot:6425201-Amphidinium_carterae.1
MPVPQFLCACPQTRQRQTSGRIGSPFQGHCAGSRPPQRGTLLKRTVDACHCPLGDRRANPPRLQPLR